MILLLFSEDEKSPDNIITQSSRKYIDSESLKLESFSGVLFSTPKSSTFPFKANISFPSLLGSIE